MRHNGRSILLAILVACVVGAGVMVVVNGAMYAPFAAPGDRKAAYFGFWGVLWGACAAPFAFGIALAVFRREFVPRRSGRGVAPASALGPPKHKVGLLIAAIVAGIFGLLVGLYNVAWGLDVWSLEGAWLWPLCIVPLTTSAWLLRAYLKGLKAGRSDF